VAIRNLQLRQPTMSNPAVARLQALRTRVSISANGTNITLIRVPCLPDWLCDAGNLPPRNASSRKQMRHSLNLRSVPRLRAAPLAR